MELRKTRQLKQRKRRTLLSWSIFSICLSTLFHQNQLQAQDNSTISDVNNFFFNKTEIENILSLRDPFRPPMLKAEIRKDTEKGILKKGTFTNIPDIEALTIPNLRVKGVLLGPERQALVTSLSDKDNHIYTLSEGMLIGKDKAEVKAIVPGGIILLEKIENIYGQEEYLETVIPISGQ